MTDYTELKRLAEACGDLNWRTIQENWCEWAIRDDHGYIAVMRTKSAKHPGPCSDREAKAKFLCAMTPAAVLALLAENKQFREGPAMRAIRSLRSDCADLMAERDQLKAENARSTEREILQLAEIEALRKALNELLDLYDTDDGCRSLPQYIAARAALSKGEQP